MNKINTQLIFIHGIAIMRAVSVCVCVHLFRQKFNPPHYLNEDEALNISKKKEKKKEIRKLSILIKIYGSISSGT